MTPATIKVSPVKNAPTRRKALEVLRATYLEEKQWVRDAESQLPESDLSDPDIAWFVATLRTRPIGVLRVHYAPPVEQYADYGVEFFDKSVDIRRFLAANRIAEIGRFAVIPSRRNQMFVAVALMRAATTDTVRRQYTHYVTDVFEDDPHSPYGFHTRVMGFMPVATHDHGELYCRSRRITLLLDLASAYRRLRTRGNWIFRSLTEGWDDAMHRQLDGAGAVRRTTGQSAPAEHAAFRLSLAPPSRTTVPLNARQNMGQPHRSG